MYAVKKWHMNIVIESRHRCTRMHYATERDGKADSDATVKHGRAAWMVNCGCFYRSCRIHSRALLLLWSYLSPLVTVSLLLLFLLAVGAAPVVYVCFLDWFTLISCMQYMNLTQCLSLPFEFVIRYIFIPYVTELLGTDCEERRNIDL